MYRKICEKTLYDVLRYKKHKQSMLRYEIEKGKGRNPYYANSYLSWVKYQVQEIEIYGLDKWLQGDEALGKDKCKDEK